MSTAAAETWAVVAFAWAALMAVYAWANWRIRHPSPPRPPPSFYWPSAWRGQNGASARAPRKAQDGRQKSPGIWTWLDPVAGVRLKRLPEQESALAQLPSETAARPEASQARVCPECGASFASRWPQQMFCSPAHKAAFHNLQIKRGFVLTPLMEVWRAESKRAGGDRELAAYAFREGCALLDLYAQEDRDAGRDASLVIAAKRNARWRARDKDAA